MEPWFREWVPEAVPPLAAVLITGGHSNLTYRITDVAGASWVLRRPPDGHEGAGAHDVAREQRIMSALWSTDVPAPVVVGGAAAGEVLEVPFFVMEDVAGVVIHDEDVASGLSRRARRRAGESLAEALAAIHAVDPGAVGLTDLGRPDGYVERQLRRWWDSWEVTKRRDLPVMDEVHRILCSQVPDQRETTLVHGDYRLDNCIFDSAGALSAVLDWELCTLGDPLVDVGLLCIYWNDPGDELPPLFRAPTAMAGFPSREEIIARYAEASGRDLGELRFYLAFGYWKVACVLQSVDHRYRSGALGPAPEGSDFPARVSRLADLALAAAQASGGDSGHSNNAKIVT